MLQEKPNMQPNGNLDLQPGDNVKKCDRRREGKEDQLGFGAMINLDRVGVVLEVLVVGGRRFLIVLILQSLSFPCLVF